MAAFDASHMSIHNSSSRDQQQQQQQLESKRPCAVNATGAPMQKRKVGFYTKNQQGERDHFRMPEDTHMRRLFNAYATKKGINVTLLRVFFNGNRIMPYDTPKMLEMEDGDTLDMLLEQAGD
jgi:small ubiquitin-related modifier